MKVTHHKDGSYSITGMIRDDLADITFAVMLAHHWYAHDDRQRDGGDPEWCATQRDAYRRLEAVLDDVERWSGVAEYDGLPYLPKGRSIDLLSTYRSMPDRWAVTADGRRIGKGHKADA